MGYTHKLIRRAAFILVLSVLCLPVMAQRQGHYWVYFHDKGPEAEQYLNGEKPLPMPMLNARAEKGITIDHADVPVSATYLQQLESIPGIKVEYASRWLNAASVQVSYGKMKGTWQFTAGQLPPAFMEKLIEAIPYRLEDTLQYHCSAVQKISPVRGMTFDEGSRGIEQLPLNNNSLNAWKSTMVDYGAADTQNLMLGIDYLHDQGFDGNGIKVAVLDAGFTDMQDCDGFDHLFTDNRILGTYNVLDSTANVNTGNYHGSWVLSCIGADLAGTYKGMATGASFYLAIAEPSSAPYDETDWIAAAEWADAQGVDIIHSSLGYFYDSDLSGLLAGMEDFTYDIMDGESSAITRAADMAADNGILVVNSVGNTISVIDYDFIVAPCDGDSVLCVGGVLADETHSPGSCSGPTYDGRIKPEVVALGRDVSVMGGAGATVSTKDGTSFSAPLVSGLAACLMQKHPDATNMQVFEAIVKSGDRYGNADTLYGNGIPNARRADSLLNILTTVSSPNAPETNLMLYPSPANNYLKIRVDHPHQLTQVQLISTKGKVMKTLPYAGNGLLQLDVKDLPPGLYFVVVHSAKGDPEVRRFVKQ